MTDRTARLALKKRLGRTWSAFFERHGNFTPVQLAAIPILLAGGLTSENAASAIQQVNPWGVDVASGVESGDNPRKKDIEKMEKFIKTVKKGNK